MYFTIYRGDVCYADLNPIIGSEQSGIRPVLILQNNVGNRFSSTVVVAAITAQTDKSPLPTHVLVEQFKGLPKSSLVLLEQLRTIDRERLRDNLGSLSPDTMQQVDEALQISVGLHLAYL